MLVVLWICTIIIFMLAYLINKRDLLAPSVLCSMIYVICVMFTVLNQKSWGIEYSDKAFCVMIIMILSFVLPSVFFNIKNNKVVAFPNGNFLSSVMYYNNSTGEYYVINDSTVIDDNYVDKTKESVEKMLEVSNSIIVYDLLNKKESSND